MGSRGSFRLSIEGIEATQATQFYKSFRDLYAATAEPVKFVPRVARKPLAIRVYADFHGPAGCRGEL